MIRLFRAITPKLLDKTFVNSIGMRSNVFFCLLLRSVEKHLFTDENIERGFIYLPRIELSFFTDLLNLIIRSVS